MCVNLPDSPTNDWQWDVVVVRLIAVILCFAVVFGLFTRLPRSLTGGLRGNRVFIVQLPHQHGQSEQIQVYTDQSATRGFYPLQQSTAYSEIRLPADLWTELHTLRQQWCEHAPQVQHDAELPAGYEIAVQCGRLFNPVIPMPVEALPEAFRTLMKTVPPPLNMERP